MVENREDDLQKIHKRMLDILITIDSICDKHNIPYWMSGGTLLGAIRHKGFIPWDDDLDIQLKRKDFKKLIKILPDELPDTLKLQTHQTDPAYFSTYAKIRDTRSEISELDLYEQYKLKGVFIDIFPVEKASTMIVKLSSLMQWKFLIKLCLSPGRKNYKQKLGNLLFYCYQLLYGIFRMIGCLCREKRYNYSYGTYFPLNCTEEDIFPIRKIEFEGHFFNAPNSPEKYLTQVYGDYMQLPPLEKRVSHDIKLIQFEE